MKKTVTTILSLALALILVSSLSSGVILAKGDDDHDNRKRNKNKYHTVRDVAILDCGFNQNAGPILVVLGFYTTPEVDLPEMIVPFEMGGPTATTCVEGTAILLSDKYKLQDGAGGVESFQSVVTRYMFLKTRRVKN